MNASRTGGGPWRRCRTTPAARPGPGPAGAGHRHAGWRRLPGRGDRWPPLARSRRRGPRARPVPRVGAVDLVAGHPGGRDAGVQRTGEHLGGQGRLGRKPDLVGDADGLAVLRIVGPGPRQVEAAVYQDVPGAGGIHLVDRDLDVLNPARGAGVLALHPNGGGALLEVPGLVDDQHRIRAAEVLDDVGTHVVTDRVLIPDRSAEQMLHPVWAGVTGMLSDRPAVLTRQVGQQPQHERPGVLAWLHAAKPARDPARNSSSPACHCAGATLWPPSDLWLSSQHQIISGGRLACPPALV